MIALGEFQLLWYEHWLKGKNVGLDQIPRVQVFATGANRWLGLSDWPAPEVTPAVYHLAGTSQEGESSKGRGVLVSGPAKSASSVQWRHDPDDVGGRRDIWFSRSTRLWYGPDDGDNVVFVTEPFTEDTLLSGPVEVELWLSSDAVDTDVFGVLTEIDEGGRARALHQTSSFRVRYRDGFNNPKPLEPDVPERVTFALADFAHLFKSGESLGLAIRSELFPAAARNLGTMEPYATGTTVVVQENTIHTGPGYPSQLRLHRLPVSLLADPE